VIVLFFFNVIHGNNAEAKLCFQKEANPKIIENSNFENRIPDSLRRNQILKFRLGQVNRLKWSYGPVSIVWSWI